jgi:hypothetical protein
MSFLLIRMGTCSAFAAEVFCILTGTPIRVEGRLFDLARRWLELDEALR